MGGRGQILHFHAYGPVKSWSFCAFKAARNRKLVMATTTHTMKYPVLAIWASQLKTSMPPALKLQYVSAIAASTVIAIAWRGRPRESTWATHCGIRFWYDINRSIRDAMKIDSAAIDETATKMTALRKSGSPWMPDSLSAMTNGEAATPELPKSCGLSAGTRSVMKTMQTK